MDKLEERIELLENKLLLLSHYVENSLEVIANTSDINTMDILYKLNDQYNNVWEKLENEEVNKL